MGDTNRRILNGITPEAAEDSARRFFGQRMRESRERIQRGAGHPRGAGLGITQDELARAIDVTQATISRWEDGLREPTLFYISQISIALRADITWLIRGTVPAGVRTEQLLTTLAGRIGIAANEIAAQLAKEAR